MKQQLDDYDMGIRQREERNKQEYQYGLYRATKTGEKSRTSERKGKNQILSWLGSKSYVHLRNSRWTIPPLLCCGG